MQHSSTKSNPSGGQDGNLIEIFRICYPTLPLPASKPSHSRPSHSIEKKMATISSLTTPLPTSTKLALSTNQSKPSFQILKPANPFNHFPKFTHLHKILNTKAPQRLFAVAEETAPAAAVDPSSEAARRLYVGNIPRTLTNEELTKIVEEHGAVEKAEVNYGLMVS